MKKVFFSLLAFFFTSCNISVAPDRVSEGDKMIELQKSKFDNSIITNFEKYEQLNSFLQENLNEIIDYRNSKHKVTLVNGKKNGEDSIYLEHQECYTFFEGHPEYEYSNFPEKLQNELLQILNSIGKRNIIDFEICKNGKVSITAKKVDKKNGLYILHSLIWNIKSENDFKDNEIKDSTINDNCKYRISLFEHYGH